MILLTLSGSSAKKCVSTIYGPSESDTDSHLTLDHDTHHNSNYVTNSESQDSKDEGSKCGNWNENEIQGDSMDTGEEESSRNTNLQYRGPCWHWFDDNFSHSKKNPRSNFLYIQIVATTNMEGVTKQVKVKHEISNAQ